jgi:hypothetical protein
MSDFLMHRALGFGQPGSVKETFIQDCLCSIIIQLSWYFLLRLNKGIREDPKRTAWLLTLLTAIIITPCSVPYVYHYVWHWNEDANFQTDRLAQFIVTYFVTFLVTDCACCVAHYYAHMGAIDGWFHHACYVGFFGWCLAHDYSIGIMTTMPLEVPTIVIALGRVVPAFRQDLLFGAAFFATRVCYHSFLLFRWYRMDHPPTRLWPYPAFILGLHLYWFTLWIMGQMKRASGAKAVKKS